MAEKNDPNQGIPTNDDQPENYSSSEENVGRGSLKMSRHLVTSSRFFEFQTPPSSRSGTFSPRSDFLLLVERIDMTPEGVKRNILQLREIMNNYAQEERAKGIRIMLDYDEEPEVTLSPTPRPLNSIPSTSRRNAQFDR